MSNHLIEYMTARQADIVATLRQLVELESPSDNKPALDRLGAFIASQLREAGASVQVVSQATAGDHLVATCGDAAPDSAPIVTLCHIDTVWPMGTIKTIPWSDQGGTLRGPGVFDMKAGLAIAGLAMRALAQESDGLPGVVVLLVTADEETGSAASRGIIEAEARVSDAALVLEPALPGGALKTRRKGCGEFVLRVSGRAAHAGIEPELGASAISELARQIPRIEALRDAAAGTAVNVGVVRGGSRPNVVAADAEAVIDVRVASAAEAARVTAALGALKPVDPGTRVAVAGGIDRPPMERSAAGAALFAVAQAVAADLGRTLGEGGTGGGSDGNLTAALGVPTLDGLGAVGGGAHADDEHVTIADLPWRAALVAGLLRRILAV